MSGFVIGVTLYGILCGNLAAVVFRAFNVGLFWNSVTGAAGSLLVSFGPGFWNAEFAGPWYAEFTLSGATAMLVMLLAGALVELRYR